LSFIASTGANLQNQQIDGYDVLMSRVALQNSVKKSEMLENRIKRLAFEASRAQKVTDTVTLKAEKLLEARERHQKEIEEKHRLHEKRLMDEERQRIRNLSVKQQSITRRELIIETVQQRNKVRQPTLRVCLELQGLHPEQGERRLSEEDGEHAARLDRKKRESWINWLGATPILGI